MKQDVVGLTPRKMALTAHSRLEVLQVFKLLQSVHLEDKDQISKLCTQGIPMLINYRDPNRGECALHLAARSNNETITQFLIGLGAYPNVQDFEGRTPIMRAAEYGHEKAVNVLVETGADLMLKDKEGRDVIFYSFSYPTTRHQRCLQMVMENGAKANNTLQSEMPTLVSACSIAGENEGSCLTLIESGADPNAKNKVTGRSALAAACASGNAAVVKALLIKGADPNVRDKRQLTPVHLAAEAGALEIVKSLAAFGADLTVSDKDHNNPLHYAAEGGYGMICKYLGQRGCNPKLKNTDGFTPRLLAKEKSFKEASKELRKAEKSFTKYSKPEATNPNPPDLLYFYDWICTREASVREALMASAQPLEEESEQKSSVITLHNFGQVMRQLNAPLSEDMTKRIVEAHDDDRKGNIVIDEFLSGKKYVSKTYLMSAFEGKKKKGKKGKKKGKGKKGKFKIPLPICTEKDGPRRPDGGPPKLYLERQFHWSDNIRFDRENPPQHPLQDDSAWYLPTPDKQYVIITDAVKGEELNTLKQAFESGTDVDLRDKYFKTPLMASCSEGNVVLTKYFLELGANVEARDNFKWTPLHHACHSGQLDVVQILLYAGADGNSVTWNGATPLMRAIESGKTDLVRFLLDCNVNVTAMNKKEKTAVDVARDWGSAEIYQMVKEKYEAAPKPKKDKKGNLRQPPAPQISIPGLNKVESSLLPGISNPDKLDTKPGLRPVSAQLYPPFTTLKLNILKKERGFERSEKRTVVDFSLEHYNRGERPTREKITFTPKKAWTEQPSMQQLLDAKQEKRLRFGEDIDFDNYEKPLKQNIIAKEKEIDLDT